MALEEGSCEEGRTDGEADEDDADVFDDGNGAGVDHRRSRRHVSFVNKNQED